MAGKKSLEKKMIKKKIHFIFGKKGEKDKIVADGKVVMPKEFCHTYQ